MSDLNCDEDTFIAAEEWSEKLWWNRRGGVGWRCGEEEEEEEEEEEQDDREEDWEKV